MTNEKSAFIARYSELGDLIWIEGMVASVMKMHLFRGSKQDGGFIAVGSLSMKALITVIFMVTLIYGLSI